MLMAARGGGRVLITYLQWRSLDGLARPSKNSCEIRRNNRRVAAVAVAEGGTRGGFAAAEALHSNGMGCLEWRDTLPTPFPTSSPLSSSATNLTTLRREEVLSCPCSQSPDLFLNTKCGRGPEKWVVFVLSSVPLQNGGHLQFLTPSATHAYKHTKHMQGYLFWPGHLLLWPTDGWCKGVETYTHTHIQMTGRGVGGACIPTGKR